MWSDRRELIVTGTQGTVIWFEIWVSDLARAQAFYSGMFGWTFAPLSEYDASGNYQEIQAGDAAGVHGALVHQPGRPRPTTRGTIVYVHVPDLEEAMKKAVSLGGGLVQKPTAIGPSMGTFALIIDIDGNEVGLWVP
jgi:predicted enzyme related to lactoylglutathione lyase